MRRKQSIRESSFCSSSFLASLLLLFLLLPSLALAALLQTKPSFFLYLSSFLVVESIFLPL